MGTIDILGIYVPTLLVEALAALLATLILTRVLARMGFYRLAWHPALVNISLFVILLSAISLSGGFRWWVP
jgi:fatty-acid desaturase